jgi:two-component system phosphate regulon response regulator OmpR
MAEPLVLLVEDDARLRDLLERYLLQQGLRVRAVANLAGLRAQLAQQHVDLVVLDLMLADGDGLAACRDLRAEGVATPVIVLTARGDDVDRIIGLEMGADDYLAKPCNPRELVARIRAVLRRAPPVAGGAPRGSEMPLRFGPFVLDPATRELHREGQAQRLTSGEFAVLWSLVSHARKTLTRDHLMNLAHGRDHEANDRSIDVMVSRLRRLIEDDPRRPRRLQTVWGTGYVFVPDGPANSA